MSLPLNLTSFAPSVSSFLLDRLQLETQNLRLRLAHIRPPQEFFDVRRVSKPASVGDAQQRVSYNIHYFGTNYLVIVGALSLYSLLTNMLLLFVLVLVFGGVFGISRLGGDALPTPFGPLAPLQLYTALACVAVPLGFWALPISTLMWLIGSSAVCVLGHASLMEKPIETVFEEETV